MVYMILLVLIDRGVVTLKRDKRKRYGTTSLMLFAGMFSMAVWSGAASASTMTSGVWTTRGGNGTSASAARLATFPVKNLAIGTSERFSVKVFNRRGKPVAGAVVRFLSANRNIVRVANATTRTARDGIASVTLTSGMVGGNTQIRIQVGRVAHSVRVTTVPNFVVEPTILMHGFNSNATDTFGTMLQILNKTPQNKLVNTYSVNSSNLKVADSTPLLNTNVRHPLITFQFDDNHGSFANQLTWFKEMMNQLVRDYRQEGVTISKVNVVAHSMGGIDATEYIGDYMDHPQSWEPKVDKLITIDTPFEGSSLGNDFGWDKALQPAVNDLALGSAAVKKLNAQLATGDFDPNTKVLSTTGVVIGGRGNTLTDPSDGVVTRSSAWGLAQYTNVVKWTFNDAHTTFSTAEQALTGRGEPIMDDPKVTALVENALWSPAWGDWSDPTVQHYSFTVDPDYSAVNTTMQVTAGDTYRLTTSGSMNVTPASPANNILYLDPSAPLGVLLGDIKQKDGTDYYFPIQNEAGGTITMPASGDLYLTYNDVRNTNISPLRKESGKGSEIEARKAGSPASGSYDVQFDGPVTLQSANTVQIPLGSFFNNDGSGTGVTPQMYDNSGNAYVPSKIPSGLFTANVGGQKVAFQVSGSNPDNMTENGQTIPVSAPSGLNTLWLLGSATNVSNDNAQSTLIVDYSDGTSVSLPYSLSDWMEQPATLPDNEIPVVNSETEVNNLPGYMYAVNVPIDPSKTVKSIQIGTNGNDHIWAMTIANSTMAAGLPSTSQ